MPFCFIIKKNFPFNFFEMLQLRAKFEICVMSYSTFVMDRKFRWPLECLNYEALTCNLLLNLAISAGLITPLRVTDSQFKPSGGHWNFSAWKVSKYGVIPGPNTENTNQKSLRIWTLFMQCLWSLADVEHDTIQVF